MYSYTLLLKVVNNILISFNFMFTGTYLNTSNPYGQNSCIKCGPGLIRYLNFANSQVYIKFTQVEEGNVALLNWAFFKFSNYVCADYYCASLSCA